MYTGTVWGITLIVVGFLLSVGALQLVMGVAAPGLIGQAAANLERKGTFSRLLMLLAGVLALGVAIVLLAALANAGPAGKALQVIVAIPTVFTAAAALAAASLCVGGRLPAAQDAAQPWRRLVRGAATLGLAWVVPFVGWFLILPGCAATGTGALLWALFQREGRRQAAEAWLPATVAAEPAA